MQTDEELEREAAKALRDGRTLRTEDDGRTVIWVRPLSAARVLGAAGHYLVGGTADRLFSAEVP